MKLKIIEEHDQIIDSIKEASTKTKGDFLFINIDSHSDMGFYDINEKPDIGTFIIYSVYQNLLLLNLFKLGLLPRQVVICLAHIIEVQQHQHSITQNTHISIRQRN